MTSNSEFYLTFHNNNKKENDSVYTMTYISPIMTSLLHNQSEADIILDESQSLPYHDELVHASMVFEDTGLIVREDIGIVISNMNNSSQLWEDKAVFFFPDICLKRMSFFFKQMSFF